MVNLPGSSDPHRTHQAVNVSVRSWEISASRSPTCSSPRTYDRMRALQERWQWKAGIALKDWRYVVRICNIDVSNLAGGSPEPSE